MFSDTVTQVKFETFAGEKLRLFLYASVDQKGQI